MMAGNENKPPPYLPPNYVTLDMLRQRYLKAQEQKRLDREKEERESAIGREGDSNKREKETSGEVSHSSSLKANRRLEESENRKRRDKAVAEEVQKVQSKNSSSTASSHPPVKTYRPNKWKSKKERENQKRPEKEAKEVTEIPSIAAAVPPHHVETGCRRELEKDEGGKGKKREKNRKKKKKKAKAEETLGRSVKKVPEALAVAGGEKETVAVNNRVWVKKKVVAVVNPTAEIEDKFGDMSVSDGEKVFARGAMKDNRAENGRKIGSVLMNLGKNVLTDPMGRNDRGKVRDAKENVEDDPMAKNGRRKKNLSKSVKGNVKSNKRDGSVKHFRGTGRINRGKMQMDSSLVWVRKEDKADACVTGNCLEGVLEKAGEKEKKPGRGRA